MDDQPYRPIDQEAALEMAEVTLVLRPRTDLETPDPEVIGSASLAERRHLDPEQLRSQRGAHAEDLAAVRTWAVAAGLEVVAEQPERRQLTVRANLATLSRVFQVRFSRVRSAQGTFRAVSGQPQLQVEVASLVVAVLGLDTRPFASPRAKRLPLPDPPGPLERAAPLSFEPTTVVQAYRFPAAEATTGGCIGLIELGGGFLPADIAAYFKKLERPAPQLVVVPVMGVGNRPTGRPDGPDGEVNLDIEVAGAAAPGVRLACYFAPNTDQGFLAALSAAIHDQTNLPQVVSISWGGPEASWPASTVAAFEHVFQDAALVGITVLAASGDQGSADGLGDGLAHVDYPASSPLVLGCGGTRLQLNRTTIVGEIVWDDQPQDGATGGGVSARFPVPSWQSDAGVPPSVNPGHAPGRGVPDVAGDADPATGYQVLVDGTPAVFGGTSAVAPLWAALLVSCMRGGAGRVGYLNPLLYRTLASQGVTNDITLGDNGAYRAGPGWDPCTGWGSPQGARLLSALGG